jgi:hypothetical protein
VVPKPARAKKTIFKRKFSKIQSLKSIIIEIMKRAPKKIQNQAKAKSRNQKANDIIKPNFANPKENDKKQHRENRSKKEC